MGDLDPDGAETTGASHARAASIHSRRRLLIVYSRDPTARGRAIPLGDAPIELGRSPPTPVPYGVEDIAISRAHVRIERDPASKVYTAIDLGSRNGTFVNGTRVERLELQDNDLIRIGGTLMLFQVHRVKQGEHLDPDQSTLAGTSLAMQRVRGEIALAAGRPVPVLILGESGVGKDLSAEEIHRRSGRSGPFVPINCGALPENLVESELFGHAAGAFTGAVRNKEGLFVTAHGGTLFLDEIGEMPMPVQAKLLRALDKGEVRPVGGNDVTRVDVRVIAATNRDLSTAISEGGFRGDLYARLGGFVLRIPPFRERREDILVLAQQVLKRSGASLTLSPDVAETLLLYRWPYNAREIQQALATALVRAAGSATIDVHHLPNAVLEPILARLPEPVSVMDQPAPELTNPRAGGMPTEQELRTVLAQFKGNVARAAEFFGKDRRQVYRWAERMGIDPEQFRDG